MLYGSNKITNTLFQRRTYLLMMKIQEPSGILVLFRIMKYLHLRNILSYENLPQFLLHAELESS